MTKNRIVELEAVLQFGQRRAVALDVQQQVVGLVQLLDRIGELAATPVLEAVDLSATRGDEPL
jgi:hypothetical protein